MLIVNVKNGESLERAIRRYRRKYRDTGVRKEIFRRKEYRKPSVVRRNEILKAMYKEQKLKEMD